MAQREDQIQNQNLDDGTEGGDGFWYRLWSLLNDEWKKRKASVIPTVVVVAKTIACGAAVSICVYFVWRIYNSRRDAHVPVRIYSEHKVVYDPPTFSKRETFALLQRQNDDRIPGSANTTTVSETVNAVSRSSKQLESLVASSEEEETGFLRSFFDRVWGTKEERSQIHIFENLMGRGNAGTVRTTIDERGNTTTTYTSGSNSTVTTGGDGKIGTIVQTSDSARGYDNVSVVVDDIVDTANWWTDFIWGRGNETAGSHVVVDHLRGSGNAYGNNSGNTTVVNNSGYRSGNTTTTTTTTAVVSGSGGGAASANNSTAGGRNPRVFADAPKGRTGVVREYEYDNTYSYGNNNGNVYGNNSGNSYGHNSGNVRVTTNGATASAAPTNAPRSTASRTEISKEVGPGYVMTKYSDGTYVETCENTVRRGTV